jgi:glycyl-tRNA synthetase beta chain
MPNLVLEIGTEEMPAAALPGAISQLREAVEKRLAEARLPAGSVKALGTPRRLVVMASGLPERQPDVEREVRGPAWNVAFDGEGKPTGAAIGFARKQGVPVEALTKVQTPQGDYVLARVTDAGKPATEAIGPALLECVRSLTFPKVMRWGDGPTRFVRPVRRIVCLLDHRVAPLEFAGVTSGRTTRGHRYLGGPVELPHADQYAEALRSAWVMTDPEERRAAIVEQGDKLAASVGGTVPWDADLLEENVHLVEWPTCLLGRFEARFLDLPRPVLVTAMKKHQRFFPVEGSDGRLLPCFISVRNGGPEHLDKVRAGNEAVLRARFEDARHFFLHDREVPLDRMAEKLDRLVFQEKLGTMAQKAARLQRLVKPLAEAHGLDADQIELATRAARLCKADLTSEMVIELPSLQGIMGREYALLQGEPEAVADAIAEHYRPRSASDALPTTSLGKLLAVADRMDTLVGYAGLGITPSGSQDPFGLRRAATGVVQILAEEEDVPSLAAMQVQAAEGYREVNGLDFPLDPLCNALQTLFHQRIAAYLSERDVRYDLVDAALYGGPVYGTVVRSVVLRGLTLNGLADDVSFVPTVQAAARVANILGPADPAPIPGKEGIHGGRERAVERAVALLEEAARRIDPSRFEDPAERRLYEAALLIVPGVARAAAAYDFQAVYAELQAIRDPVNAFFDDVLVMSEDAALRANRLALLGLVDALYKTLADFRKVVVTG